jgi:inorganic pyrophosphatase
MKRVAFTLLAFLFIISPISCATTSRPYAYVAPGLKLIDEYTIVGERSFLTGYHPVNSDGTINVVIEIPAGTTAKWEVTKPEGTLNWEFKKGKPPMVKYLGYPGNYGMVPQTLLPEEVGGDGDPLDVIVLGQAVPRGSVVRAKVIGVLKLVDRGKQDDKILAVLNKSPLYKVNNLQQLNSKFPGVTSIVETWFISYKGPGKMESKGYGDVQQATKLINEAVEAFKTYH